MMRPRSISLRWWLPIIILSAFALMLVAATLWQYKHQEAQLEQRTNQLIRDRMANLQQLLEGLLRLNQKHLVAEVIANFGTNLEVNSLTLADAQGSVLYSTNRIWPGKQISSLIPGFDAERYADIQQARLLSLVLDKQRDVIIAYQPISLATNTGDIRPGQVGVLLLDYSLSLGKEELRRELLSQLVINLIISGFGIALLMLALRRWLSQPLNYLSDVVKRISRGDFTTEIEITGRGEMYELGSSVQQMQIDLAKAQSDLRIGATAFETHESLMITDADRVILRVNQAFTEDTGYAAAEIVGKTPRILRSGRHNAAFYSAIWKTIHETGKWQGEIWDRRKNGDIYPKWLTVTAVKNSNGTVTHYVGSHIDIADRKAAEEEIQLLAFYDSLTQLPNRRLFMDRLEHALASSMRSGRSGALLFIDLDNFKTLNDTLGHEIGDLLLRQVAQRLKTCVREGDTVARFGGDEFSLLLENLSAQELEASAQMKAIGDKILAALQQPFQLAAHEHRCTASIGATRITGNTPATDELLKQADIAMYQAKKAGRNTLRFFDPQMQTSITARAALESELYIALEKQQFQLYYQIQVDEMNRPLGAETLIRWIHPERGFVSPMQFIPLAEETGLILSIGHWVLETACAQLRKWQQDVLTRNLSLSVNVSARQFRQADFASQVESAVQHHGINPGMLKLELTESMLQENIEGTVAIMNTLKKIGVQFSLDDFGTGYSSLQYLKRLPLDQLKIDQSFVRDIVTVNSDKAIVRTIIAMAHSLELDVIAEGVETEEQRQLLLNDGCANCQGYLFSKPVPIEQFEALLRQG